MNKKITVYILALISFTLFNCKSYAQVSIIESFPSSTIPLNWSYNGFGFTSTAACQNGGGIGAIRKNQYSLDSSGDIQTRSWLSNGQDLTIKFAYKILDYTIALPTVATLNSPSWGSIITEVSTDNGLNYNITAGTIDNSNHIVSNQCVDKVYTISGTLVPNGNMVRIRIRLTFEGSTPDYFVYLDNFQINQSPFSPPNCASQNTPPNLTTNVSRNVIIYAEEPGVSFNDFDFYFGETPQPPLLSNGTSTYYTSMLEPNKQYYWRAVPKNIYGSALNCPVKTFTTGSLFEYLPSNYQNGSCNGDEITNVTLGNLNNSSGCTSSPSYTFYNNVTIPDLQQGDTRTIYVTMGANSTQYSRVWIDFNQDGSLDSSESFFTVNAGSNGTATIQIVIPSNAVLGNTTMRVIGGEDNAPFFINPGGVFVTNSGGETEDYIVNIIEPQVECATNVFPLNSAISIPKGNVNLQWNQASYGISPSSYDVYFGTTSGNLSLITNTTNTNYTVSAPNYATTYYWKIIPKTNLTEAMGCDEWSFTTENDPFAPYCSAINYLFSVRPITLVNFAGINNSSNEVVNGTPAIENFISTSGNVTTEESYTLTLQSNTSGNARLNYRVYFDWNQNGILDDAGEMYDAGFVMNSTGLDGIQAISSIQVPANALPGSTRMRIKSLGNLNIDQNPCTGSGIGQTEDYTIIVTPCTPVNWYTDNDGDGFGDDSSVVSACNNPGGLVSQGGDCDDNNNAINPGMTEVCWNGIDDNCDMQLSESCAPIVVNMATANNWTLPSFAIAVSAHPYTNPGVKEYRFSITNNQTSVMQEVTSSTRFVTIPSNMRNYNISYTITASAIANGEIVPYAGNTIVVNSPVIGLVKLAPSSCGETLASLSSIISSTVGLNATAYIFRARLTSDNGPTPTYYTVQSLSRFVSMNSFSGLVPQYGANYTITVQYQFLDIVSGLPELSGYGEECSVTMPRIPTIGLSSPTCGTTLTSFGQTISANPAAYALEYEFRIRLTSDNGPTPTYYYTAPSASRFSSMSSFQGLTLQYNTSYTVDVRYKILNNGLDVWSEHGSICQLTTPILQVSVTRSIELPFTVVAYPNPFADNFKLDVKNSINTPIVIKVYDILGRLIDQQQVNVDDIETTRIGKNYPSGVFNVIVVQDDNVSTIRMIKR